MIRLADQQDSTDTQGQAAPQNPVGYTKSKKFLFFKIRSKPIYDKKADALSVGAASQRPQKQAPAPSAPVKQDTPTGTQTAGPAAPPGTKARSKYITRYVVNKKGLQESLRDVGIREDPYFFVRRMMRYAIALSIILSVVIALVFYRLGVAPIGMILLAGVCGVAFYNIIFNKFVTYPMARTKKLGKEIEKDILFATRDLVISMRSGMPLFNAMTAVSTGYGAASKEFAKVVSLIQLGMPIAQAMEEVSSRSQSKTFKRLMLQASVSIKVGADIVDSLQGVVEEIQQERVIELRRYGQRLNALAMFYMIFGVIFPSMGIAIATIMSTFISLFTIDASTLAFVIVGIIGLQLVFLNLISSSRPGFSLE